MPEAKLDNAVRLHRERMGLSQQALGERVGVRRQAIIAIEAGRQVPSTTLALQLARALGSSVDGLFQLEPSARMEVRLAPDARGGELGVPPGQRVVVGNILGGWVAHRPSSDASEAADAIIVAEGAGGRAHVRPLAGEAQLARNALVAGCAPLLALLSRRVSQRFHDARMSWISASSRASLDLLADGMVHVAGIHLSGTRAGDDNLSAVRARFPGQHMLVVNLTGWREGFVVRQGNPLGIREPADLLRPDVRAVGREEGAGARQLVSRLLSIEGAAEPRYAGPLALGHVDVARRVEVGAADVGVAIESVALARGLDFVPLAQERFDLVVPASLAATSPVARLLDALDDPGFRTEVEHIPGYDVSLSGHVTTLDAASVA